MKREEEQVLRKIIEEMVDVKGAYQKPTYYDVLWVQLFMLPYTIYMFVKFYVRWFFRFTMMKEEYGQEEKAYLTRKNLKMSQGQWAQLDEAERADFMAMQLWKKEKAEKYLQDEEEAKKAKLAESSAQKRYRRLMKKGGPGSMTFADD